MPQAVDLAEEVTQPPGFRPLLEGLHEQILSRLRPAGLLIVHNWKRVGFVYQSLKPIAISLKVIGVSLEQHWSAIGIYGTRIGMVLEL
jgi:hypothetical protein